VTTRGSRLRSPPGTGTSPRCSRHTRQSSEGSGLIRAVARVAPFTSCQRGYTCCEILGLVAERLASAGSVCTARGCRSPVQNPSAKVADGSSQEKTSVQTMLTLRRVPTRNGTIPVRFARTEVVGSWHRSRNTVVIDGSAGVGAAPRCRSSPSPAALPALRALFFHAPRSMVADTKRTIRRCSANRGHWTTRSDQKLCMSQGARQKAWDAVAKILKRVVVRSHSGGSIIEAHATGPPCPRSYGSLTCAYAAVDRLAYSGERVSLTMARETPRKCRSIWTSGLRRQP
jgi:hypothetical protein